VFEWLGDTQFSAWIRSDLWGWPFALTIHALGMALFLGFLFIIGLRVLGLFVLFPYPSLRRLFPAVWIALAVQFLSGLILWMAKPAQYVRDGAFLLKVLLVIAGIYLMLSLSRLLEQEAGSWDATRGAPSRAMKLAAAVLLVWCGVLLAGRFTAQLGSISLG
jgi:hypothetical protein